MASLAQNRQDELASTLSIVYSAALRDRLEQYIDRDLPELLSATISQDTFALSEGLSPTVRARRAFLGFNGQFIRACVFIHLLRHLPFDSFIETGTYHGHTALLVAAQTSLTVFTCDLDPDSVNFARKVLAPLASRVHLFACDSRTFLDKVLADGKMDRPFCYLDAHWNDDLPLGGELERILSRRTDYLIAIDDFRVPRQEAFGFDSYPSGTLEFEYIRPLLKKHAPGSCVWYPAYRPADETGAGRGFAIIASPGISTAIEASVPIQLLRRAPTVMRTRVSI